MTFSGFRSRCTMPASWALASPSAIWTAIGSSFRVGRAPAERISRSVLPSTLSMAIQATEPEVPDVVDRDDVRVVERRRGPRLVLEPLQARRVGRDLFMENLQGDFAAEPLVPGEVHLSHPARAEDETIS